jgi:V8-like Glu-specific endopeptidase
LNILKKMIKGILLLTLIFSSIAVKEAAVEGHLLYTATKAAPLKLKGQTFCSSSQVEYKGERFTLTNRHCCQVITRRNGSDSEKKASFTRFNLKGMFVQVGSTPREIISLDKKHDLCALEPDLTKPALKLASSYTIGERITVIGHPRGMPQTIRKGRIIAKKASVFYWVNPINPAPWTFVTNIGYGGNSGSPVVNIYGNLVGVIFMGWSQYHTEMGAVPLESVRDFLERLTNK